MAWMMARRVVNGNNKAASTVRPNTIPAYSPSDQKGIDSAIIRQSATGTANAGFPFVCRVLRANALVRGFSHFVVLPREAA
jgi:hypothetical protein